MNLRKLLDEATPRPWGVEVRGVHSPTGAALSSVMDWGDAELITALANNAEAFIELWEVAEAVNKLNSGDWVDEDGRRHTYIDDSGPDVARFFDTVEALRPLMEGNH